MVSEPADRRIVVLNLLPVAAGGGLQSALNFLQAVAGMPELRTRCHFIVRRDSPLHEICVRERLPCDSVGSGHRSRLEFELWRAPRLLDRDGVCLTLFGPPLLGARRGAINVVGCAYSNLFYPEIDFWGFATGAERFRREFIDQYRRYATKAADFWIFETEAIRRRAIEFVGFPEERVSVIGTTGSLLVSPDHVERATRTRYDETLRRGFRFLFLAGAHPNKRLHLLPLVARALEKRVREPFCFVSTMPPGHPYAQSVRAEFERCGLGHALQLLGPVPSTELSSLIDACDAVALFSVLESLSSNYVEAWTMRRPLIITDAGWARAPCGDAALYVDPTRTEAAADALATLATDSSLRDKLICAGSARLAGCLTTEEKASKFFECVGRAVELGPCASGERARISWPRVWPRVALASKGAVDPRWRDDEQER